jgi:hypothetical protein
VAKTHEPYVAKTQEPYPSNPPPLAKKTVTYQPNGFAVPIATRVPENIRCPNCKREGFTKVEYKAGAMTWLMCASKYLNCVFLLNLLITLNGFKICKKVFVGWDLLLATCQAWLQCRFLYAG